jgi:hypothetical protein
MHPQLHSTSIFITCLPLEECFIPFKILLDKNYSTSKVWVHPVSKLAQKKRCCAEICSLGASVAEWKDTFLKGKKGLGGGTIFASTRVVDL